VIAAVGPGIEFVEPADLDHLGIQRVRPAECASLPAPQRIGLTIAGRLAFAFTNVYDRVASVFTRLHAIMSGLENRKCLVGRINLEVIVVTESAHRNVDGTGRKLDLNRIVIQVQEREPGIGRQSNHGRSQLHFGA